MKIEFKSSMGGFSVNETASGDTHEEIVMAIRNKVAGRIPHIPFTKKDDHLRDNLRVDGKDDWTNQAFFEAVVGYYNKEKNTHIPVPTSCQEFIELAESLGMAKVLEP